MFSTIINRNNGDMYQGYIAERNGNNFVFYFRLDGRNYWWDCSLDYWELLV
jgi:hypothetical protein